MWTEGMHPASRQGLWTPPMRSSELCSSTISHMQRIKRGLLHPRRTESQMEPGFLNDPMELHLLNKDILVDFYWEINFNGIKPVGLQSLCHIIALDDTLHRVETMCILFFSTRAVSACGRHQTHTCCINKWIYMYNFSHLFLSSIKGRGPLLLYKINPPLMDRLYSSSIYLLKPRLLKL